MKWRDRFRVAVSVLRGEAPGPGDDYWYKDASSILTGRVSPEVAMRIAAVQACVTLMSGLLAGLPLRMFRRLRDHSTEPDPGHPLTDLLNYMPNAWQSAFEWREMMTAHLMLRGNAYSHIVPGPRGFADTLVPWHPDCVRPELIDEKTLVYHVTERGGQVKTFSNEEVFHLRDLSLDGIVGISRIKQAHMGIGMAMAAQTHAATLLKNQARPELQIVTEKGTVLTDDQKKNTLKSWNATYGGPANRGGVVVFDKGTKAEPITISNEALQLLELLNYGVEDIARIFGMPPHLLGMTEKQTSWGTGVEQMTIGFVNFHGVRWANVWEAAISRDLILIPQVFYAEHDFDNLLRGDYKTRMDGNSTAILSGQRSPDEARKKDGFKPREDGLGGKFWMPQNYRFADEPAAPQPSPGLAPGQKPNGGDPVITEKEAAA